MTSGTLAILQSFGLSPTQFTVLTNAEMNQYWLRVENWAGEGSEGDAYGIGIETGRQAVEFGLKFSNGTSALAEDPTQQSFFYHGTYHESLFAL